MTEPPIIPSSFFRSASIPYDHIHKPLQIILHFPRHEGLFLLNLRSFTARCFAYCASHLRPLEKFLYPAPPVLVLFPSREQGSAHGRRGVLASRYAAYRIIIATTRLMDALVLRWEAWHVLHRLQLQLDEVERRKALCRKRCGSCT